MFFRNCENCGNLEDRLFIDTWTGMELCIMCLEPIISRITMSPKEEGDNLPELLKEEDKCCTESG